MNRFRSGNHKFRVRALSNYAGANTCEAVDDNLSNAPNISFAYVTTLASTSTKDWIIDSGESQHQTFTRDRLSSYKSVDSPHINELGDKSVIEAHGECEIICSLGMYGSSMVSKSY